MTADFFDPTSVASRKMQAEKKQVHRIRLRKQLEKARKKLEVATSQPAPQELDSDIDEAISNALLKQPKDKNVATKGPSRPVSSKPNPTSKATSNRETRLKQMREVAEQRDREIQKVELAKVNKAKSRKQLYQKLTAKTRAGQPKLSKHIDVLLEKIQKQ